MGRKYSGSAAAARRGRSGRRRRRREAREELLREFEPFGIRLVFDADAQLERAFEPVVPIRMLDEPDDRARIHLVLLLEQGVSALGAEIEPAYPERARLQLAAR